MSPTGQWYGRTFTGLSRSSRKIALTFDDGPNDPYTLQLLEVLARHSVKATFFMLGQYAEARPDLARAVAEAGHVIGNHTFRQPNLIFLSANGAKKEIEDCTRALTDAVGPHSSLFRPPFGGRRPASLRLARSLGLEPIMWNITGWDWKAPSADYIEKKVTNRVRGGSVILLHDGGHERLGIDRSKTVAATDRILTRYQSQGYDFVTIPQMMEAAASRQSSVVS
jgi:peptidoglycan/xylan/chitin deacetylase (PgdA/CDA1 family)